MADRILVVAHVFYPELWDELACCISNFGESVDLHVTFAGEGAKVEEAARTRFPSANMRVVENRGYDVWPFFETLGAVDLSRYRYVVKLHTKRDLNTCFNATLFYGPQWRTRLLGFCSSRRRAERALRLLERRREIGMIAGHCSVIVGNAARMTSESVNVRCDRFMRQRFAGAYAQRFVAGTMFIVRAELLRPLGGAFSRDDFHLLSESGPMTADPHSEDMSHVCERLMGYVVGAQGSRIEDVRCRSAFYDLMYPLRSFLIPLARSIFRMTLKPFVRPAVWK